MGFSIRTLLLVVTVAAFCAAALLRHSAFWASAMVSLVLLFNIAGSITAWLRPQRRLFWVPFCVVGWSLFFIALVDSRFTRISAELVTTRIIYQVWSARHYDEMAQLAKDVGFADFSRLEKEDLYYLVVTTSVGGSDETLFVTSLVPFRIFYFTCQSVFCLAFSALAGLIVSFRYRGNLAWQSPPKAT
jgi:hypothetical protein